MTVIAAKVCDDTILFAADRQVTIGGWRKHVDGELSISKIVSVNEMTIGGCGQFAHSLWLFGYARNHKPLEATELDVSQFMLEYGSWMRQKQGEFRNENQFLMAYRDALFLIESDLGVFRVPGFASVGSGSHYATAAMHLGHTPREAVEVASALDIYCSGGVDMKTHVKS